jgi:predicted nucleic acid-binding protein
LRERAEARAGGFDCVVDASVGIKLFLKEPLSERADILFSRLVDDPPARFYVPDLFFVECANVL